jgi:hypothetical protein
MEDPLRTARETTCGIYDNEGCAEEARDLPLQS